MNELSLRPNLLGFELYHGERPLTLYRACEELPCTDSPKPCFAPIYDSSGQLITEYRPADHTWHTGLFFGWVHANDANLWGGNRYQPASGKYEIEDGPIHGVQRHDCFRELIESGSQVGLREHLTWLDAEDGELACETRDLSFELCKGGYRWTIESTITPTSSSLTLGGSRAKAGYSGLVLRMGPPFAEAHHICSEGRVGHEAIMKQPARWVAASGAAGGMVALFDHPRNPRHPVTWFTRKNLLGTGPLQSGDLEIASTDHLSLRHAFLVLDVPLTADSLEAEFQRFASD
ncbi:MAG: PmoA family protein [Candidatus Latescibacterota bacterium]|nr:PmoA family protein [Candidatus Latescibacterota bacterium]